jgi:drug/metabolite transporter (DMT)-like permease
VSSRALVIPHSARPARSRSPRIAVTAVFVAHGLLFASWTAHIPHIMRHLGLTDGTLGIALLGAPVGSVTAMLLASYLIPKLGSRRAGPDPATPHPRHDRLARGWPAHITNAPGCDRASGR